MPKLREAVANRRALIVKILSERERNAPALAGALANSPYGGQDIGNDLTVLMKAGRVRRVGYGRWAVYQVVKEEKALVSCLEDLLIAARTEEEDPTWERPERAKHA